MCPTNSAPGIAAALPLVSAISRRWTAAIFLGALAWAAPLFAAAGEGGINPGTPWPARDSLGRTLPTPDAAGPLKSDRFVGIFYFLTHTGSGGRSPNWDGPFDISRIFEADPAALSHPDSKLWGPSGARHYWGEPLYGYYSSTDPWVIRRHAQLLADAGVDTLIFDTTNSTVFPEVTAQIMKVFSEVRREGGSTPQVCFMVNTKAGEAARKLYDSIYMPGQYPELWFRWEGKPLLICDPAAADAEVKGFFTLRKAYWPFKMVNTPYAWHWEAAYPQPYGYTVDPGRAEEVNVSVAQNLSQAPDGHVVNMSSGEARGRSFHDGKQDASPGAILFGRNFAEQWKRAIDLDPPFVMVTGWNEWGSGRYQKPGRPIIFVDQYDAEYSRDIEPALSGHKDNYYYQLVANVRLYKGSPALPKASPPQTIKIDGGFEQWRDTAPLFEDATGDTAPRDWAGVAGTHYADRSGRNDLRAMKVARDAACVYFYASTVKPLSPESDPRWMWLLIDADDNPDSGWGGFDFMVERKSGPDAGAWLEKIEGGWSWRRVAKIEERIAGNELQLAIPRAALGLASEQTSLTLNFKWADNVQAPGNIMDFYSSGDAAPEGRFMYRYQAN